MAIYNTWKHQFGIAEEGNFGTGRNAEAGLPLTNEPVFDPGVNIIDNQMAVGTSYRQTLEYMIGNKNPSTTLEIDYRNDDLALFLHTLFQRVWEHDVTVFSKVFLPYEFAPSFKNQGTALGSGTDGVTATGTTNFSSSTVINTHKVRVGDWVDITSGTAIGLYRITTITPASGKITYTLDATSNFGTESSLSFAIYRGFPSFLSLIRYDSVNNESLQLISAIAKSINFKTASGAPVTISAEILAKTLDTSDAGQTGDTYTLSTDAFLLSQNARCLFAVPDTSTASLQAYDTTVATTNQTVVRVAGDLTAEYAVGNYITIAEGLITGASNDVLNIEEYSWDYAVYSSGMLGAQNDKIDFKIDGGAEVTATILPGRYSAPTLATAVQTALNTVGGATFTCTYDTATTKFTIAATGPSVSLALLWNTGSNTATCAGALLGYSTASDDTDSSAPYSIVADTVTGTFNDVSVTVSAGAYTGAELALEMNNLLNHSSTADAHYDVAFHPESKKFSISTTNDWKITIDYDQANSIAAVIGFDTSNPTVAHTITSNTASTMFKNVNAYLITGSYYSGTNTVISTVLDADVTTDAGNRVYAWREVKVDSLDITFTNNANPVNYNNQTVLEYIFGDFQVTGTVVLSYGSWVTNPNLEIENFVNGYEMPMIFTWGHDNSASPALLRLWGSTDGDLCIMLKARYTGAPLSGDVEIMQELPFEAVVKSAVTTNFRLPMVVIGDGTTARNWKLTRDGSNSPN